MSNAFWAAATATSTSLAEPSETLVRTLPVEGFTILRVWQELGEFGEGEDDGCALYEGSRRTVDPFSVDEKASVDGGLAGEGVIFELGGVYGWHIENKEERGRRGAGIMGDAGERIYLYPRTGAPTPPGQVGLPPGSGLPIAPRAGQGTSSSTMYRTLKGRDMDGRMLIRAYCTVHSEVGFNRHMRGRLRQKLGG